MVDCNLFFFLIQFKLEKSMLTSGIFHQRRERWGTTCNSGFHVYGRSAHQQWGFDWFHRNGRTIQNSRCDQGEFGKEFFHNLSFRIIVPIPISSESYFHCFIFPHNHKPNAGLKLVEHPTKWWTTWEATQTQKGTHGWFTQRRHINWRWNDCGKNGNWIWRSIVSDQSR